MKPFEMMRRDSGAAADPDAHRYWRISITANNGGPYYGFTEVEMRSSVGGANFITTQTANGTVTGSNEVNGSNAAYKAADKDNGSGWLTGTGGLDWWWKYDCGGAGHAGSPTESVAQILIRGSWNSPTSTPKDFTLQWSDNNTTWTTVMTVTGQTGWTGASDARTFTVP